MSFFKETGAERFKMCSDPLNLSNFEKRLYINSVKFLYENFVSMPQMYENDYTGMAMQDGL